ncbi:uncharacterized protein [Leptinotarsa decemlineata]|uniref:uncharacterized protein n=1 Tax=Leptinotarsa decemlineata TaxID=7539 RepID=UPI003D3074BD
MGPNPPRHGWISTPKSNGFQPQWQRWISFPRAAMDFNPKGCDGFQPQRRQWISTPKAVMDLDHKGSDEFQPQWQPMDFDPEGGDGFQPQRWRWISTPEAAMDFNSIGSGGFQSQGHFRISTPKVVMNLNSEERQWGLQFRFSGSKTVMKLSPKGTNRSKTPEAAMDFNRKGILGIQPQSSDGFKPQKIHLQEWVFRFKDFNPKGIRYSITRHGFQPQRHFRVSTPQAAMHIKPKDRG